MCLVRGELACRLRVLQLLMAKGTTIFKLDTLLNVIAQQYNIDHELLKLCIADIVKVCGDRVFLTREGRRIIEAFKELFTQE